MPGKFLLPAWVATAVMLSAQTAPPVGVVEGTVTNSVTGAAVRKALVTLRDTERYAGYQILTDAEGRFRIGNVTPGDYAVWAEAQGYVRDAPDYARLAPRSRAVSVAAGKTVTGLGVPLIPTAVLSGRVLDGNGDPVPGATVRMFQYKHTSAGAQMVSRQSVLADDRGEYRMSDVAPGRWYLGVQHYVRPPEASGRVHRLVPESGFGDAFYPGVERASEAAAIDVAAGANLAGTDLHLRKVPVFHIRGKVAGLPARQASAQSPSVPEYVKADTCAGGDPPFHSTAVRRDGSFDLWGLIAGPYCLTVESKGAGGQLRAARRVMLDKRDIDDVVLELEPALALRGTVAVEGVPAEKFDRARVILTPVAGGSEFSGPLQAGGAFAVTGLAPGQYRISADRFPDGVYLKSLRQGSNGISGDALAAVQPGAAALELVFAAARGQVSGKVSGAGSGLASVSITLAPAGDAAGRRDLVRTVDPEDSSGAFRFENVPPGRYHLFAWEMGDTALAGSPEFRALLQSRATSVEIHEAETQTAQPDLISADGVAEARKKLR